jgi:hypothetical protein
MDRVEAFLGVDPAGEDAPLSLWLGPPGHREQLHYDDADNLHMQLVGRKLWSLFPPTCKEALYPVPFLSVTDQPNFSQVQCSFFDKSLHSRMVLGFTMLLGLKPCQACDPTACLARVHSLTDITATCHNTEGGH